MALIEPMHHNEHNIICCKTYIKYDIMVAIIIADRYILDSMNGDSLDVCGKKIILTKLYIII